MENNPNYYKVKVGRTDGLKYIIGIYPPPPTEIIKKIRSETVQTAQTMRIVNVNDEKLYLEIKLPNSGNFDTISKIARDVTKRLVICGLEANLYPVIEDLEPRQPLF